jgi:hypothetical protein
MKIFFASLTLAMLAEVVVARNCNGGLSYCGYTLKKIGMNFVTDQSRISRISYYRQLTRRR